MAKKKKVCMIRALVPAKIKRALEHLADERGEAEAVLIREAMKEYVEKRHEPEPPGQPPAQPSPENHGGRVGFHSSSRLKSAVKFQKR
jgi:hypothetical protein